MLLFFFTHIFCTWWNFSENEFPSIVRNSINKPLFALCYSPYCPHCIGLPEGFQNYNKGIGNRSDILITSIDCYNKGGCHHFGIRGTPHIALVLGTRRRYWPACPERGPEGWDRWINERIGPNLRRVHTDEEIEFSKREPTDGGTTFLLEVSSENDEFVETMRQISKTYRIYNDTFVYIVRENVTKDFIPTVYAYYSEFCYHKFQGPISQLKSFIESNKFGVFHRYDSDEFRELNRKNVNAVLFLTDSDPSPSQKDALRLLNKDHCDSGYTFGWANVKDEKNILTATGVKSVDLPLMYHIGTNKYEGRKYKGKITKIWENNFLVNNSADSRALLDAESEMITIQGIQYRGKFYFKIFFFGIIILSNIYFVISDSNEYVSKEE
ncbi:hypothetical protein TRFO_42498 [Tritrichomonas foetus]|uniref:Thioredoxin domain-containing protein n=1 Tax=Tritrichomonas foetus TaxID=1144522 RepID=A0A1J4KX11_9EUKA|nr:hypothetical protein TRFO_42498 [Tritrichomonas foetus]|eukprot:OHT15424.1 hypothetical protein TRFO_42498 [Tritrichomonas foetus]